MLILNCLDSPQELTKIFETGRKYRARMVKTKKCSNHSLRTDSSRINFKSNTYKPQRNASTKNMVSTSRIWKSKGI